MNRIQNSYFYCNNKDTYPPFKTGLYLEEYFLQYYEQIRPPLKRKYIPALWTNFQIEPWFISRKNEMQESLNNWIRENPADYFTVVQHDDGCLLELPPNTIVYGACNGDIPIPLIYEDLNDTLESCPKKTFSEKSYLCSFIGNITSNAVMPNIRKTMMEVFKDNPNFYMIDSGGWTSTVASTNQDLFIQTTIDSKFAFAPRGYGRSSFRFFEVFQLGTIPVYIWNDVNWLPFQDTIDYSRLCISIHVSEIETIEQKLLSITEEKYDQMMDYYQEVKDLFTLQGMTGLIFIENEHFL